MSSIGDVRVIGVESFYKIASESPFLRVQASLFLYRSLMSWCLKPTHVQFDHTCGDTTEFCHDEHRLSSETVPLKLGCCTSVSGRESGPLQGSFLAAMSLKDQKSAAAFLINVAFKEMKVKFSNSCALTCVCVSVCMCLHVCGGSGGALLSLLMHTEQG